MVTPEEASLYSPMLTTGELATVAATGLLFAGATELSRTASRSGGGRARRASSARRGRKWTQAILEWEFANPRPAPSQ